MLNRSNVNHINDTLDMLAAFPVIVQCYHCSSGNVITSSSCVKCGAPLGQVAEDKIADHKRKFAAPLWPYSISSGSSSSSVCTAGSSFSPYEKIEVTALSDPVRKFIGRNGRETPVFRKCNNCWSMIDITKSTICSECGVSITYGEL